MTLSSSVCSSQAVPPLDTWQGGSRGARFRQGSEADALSASTAAHEGAHRAEAPLPSLPHPTEL